MQRGADLTEVTAPYGLINRPLQRAWVRVTAATAATAVIGHAVRLIAVDFGKRLSDATTNEAARAPPRTVCKMMGFV
eukprot:SAG31_NODE_3644_length_4030_cov_2.539557_5_plen_77_part_00